MKIDDQIQFVLDNLINSWQCRTCDTIWMHFKHNNQNGFYRMCNNPETICNQCKFIDAAIESNAIMTSERWNK